MKQSQAEFNEEHKIEHSFKRFNEYMEDEYKRSDAIEQTAFDFRLNVHEIEELEEMIDSG